MSLQVEGTEQLKDLFYAGDKITDRAIAQGPEYYLLYRDSARVFKIGVLSTPPSSRIEVVHHSIPPLGVEFTHFNIRPKPDFDLLEGGELLVPQVTLLVSKRPDVEGYVVTGSMRCEVFNPADGSMRVDLNSVVIWQSEKELQQARFAEILTKTPGVNGSLQQDIKPKPYTESFGEFVRLLESGILVPVSQYDLGSRGMDVRRYPALPKAA